MEFEPQLVSDAGGDRIFSASVSPDNTLIATAHHSKIARVWNLETGSERPIVLQHDAIVRSVAFSPDGSSIVTAADDGCVRVWDLTNGALLVGPLRHGFPMVNSARFSPDGRFVVAASTPMQLWDIR